MMDRDDLAQEMRSAAMDIRRDASDAHDPEIVRYAEIIEQYADLVAKVRLQPSGDGEKMRGVLNDAAATLLAVRATAGSDEWAESGDHFSKLCLDTVIRINAILNASPPPAKAAETGEGVAEDSQPKTASADCGWLRIGWWNDMKRRGLSDDAAYQVFNEARALADSNLQKTQIAQAGDES